MGFLSDAILGISYVFPLVNRWSTNLSIERSYTVSIYRLMIEQYARERVDCNPLAHASTWGIRARARAKGRARARARA
ncbi:hypothetical protein J1N35_041859 [Gossypium stocksii]|uniref:Uncharacterized protein n=1 Tax=Gossypium stocksii TaxID=47602 RepID=A0A9D3UGB0_9ROSI|nr:hypothetical protein J1N35_041859 [Gossypium stocksii]